MTIINATPHPIAVFTEKEKMIFQPSGIIPRVKEISGNLNKFSHVKKETEKTLKDTGINFIYTEFDDITDLPDETGECIYIVSSIVKSAAPERNDLVVPKDFVRDEEGKIIGCKSLSF